MTTTNTTWTRTELGDYKATIDGHLVTITKSASDRLWYVWTNLASRTPRCATLKEAKAYAEELVARATPVVATETDIVAGTPVVVAEVEQTTRRGSFGPATFVKATTGGQVIVERGDDLFSVPLSAVTVVEETPAEAVEEVTHVLTSSAHPALEGVTVWLCSACTWSHSGYRSAAEAATLHAEAGQGVPVVGAVVAKGTSQAYSDLADVELQLAAVKTICCNYSGRTKDAAWRYLTEVLGPLGMDRLSGHLATKGYQEALDATKADALVSANATFDLIALSSGISDDLEHWEF